MQIANIPQNQAQEYARVAQLKQQTAASQQEMQQRQLEMKAQQQQLNDQDALTKTISQFDPAKHSINDVPKMITSNGGSGQKALEAQQSMIAQRQNYLKMSDDQFATEQKKADLFQGVHDAVTNAKPEDKNSVYQQGLHQLSASGIDVSKEPIEYPGDDVFAQHLAPIQLHSAFVEQAAKDRQAAQESAKARLDNAQAAHQEFTNKLTENSKPGDFDKQVDALVPPTGAQGQVQNQFVKGQVNAALSRGDLDSAKKFIDQQYENTLGVNKDIAVQTNPQIQAGKVNVAKATAQAKQDVQNQEPLPIKTEIPRRSRKPSRIIKWHGKMPFPSAPRSASKTRSLRKSSKSIRTLTPRSLASKPMLRRKPAPGSGPIRAWPTTPRWITPINSWQPRTR